MSKPSPAIKATLSVASSSVENPAGPIPISAAKRGATNVSWQATDVTKAERARLKGQKPCCLWFTGLSGSGKSTIANRVERELHTLGRHTFILDGDNVRHGLSRDLGFSDADRVENIRRAAHAARLMVDAGLMVLVAFISPFRSDRRMARELFEAGDFVEVFIDTPLEICEQRDPKGLYRKARKGLIPHFTGISSPYEAPENAEIQLSCGSMPPEQAVEEMIAKLRRMDVLQAELAGME
jgi:bifunctional enzyme CysN/CysC